MQTAQGLAAAHQVGLVHRDIKPANILLENGVERVKITDFGLARAVDDASVTQSGTVAGTPMYMSPEQAEGLAVDHRSDLFSLGSMLYAMCAGHPPFRASGTHAVLGRVIEATPRPIREINSEIPEWLEAIIARLHAKPPEDRFQTAKEVAELLGRHLADMQAGHAVLGEPTRLSNRVAPPKGGPPRASSRLVLKQGLAAAAVWLGGGVAIALVLLAVALSRKWPKHRDDAKLTEHPAIASPALAVAPFTAAQANECQEAWAKHLAVPVELTNAIGMKLRLIPPGKFLMGSTEVEVNDLVGQLLARDPQARNEQQVRDIPTEAPQRVEAIAAPFYLGQYEVTVGQFMKFVEATGYRTTAEAKGQDGWRRAEFALSDHYPVARISLPDADALCAWLSRTDGRAYVLPDEKQWEFACRAGTTASRYGDDLQALTSFAWIAINSGGRPHAVGGRMPNAFGLSDMLGNVEELCRARGGGAVGRGGAWHLNDFGVRCAARNVVAGEETDDRRGFRIAVVGDLNAKPPAEATPAAR
jgi:formylglycine-generating enzyme required for sulfatase activity